MKFNVVAAAAVAVLAFSAATFAQAQDVVVNLKGVDLTSEAGVDQAKDLLDRAVDAQCGDAIQPGPLALKPARLACRAEIKRIGLAQIEQTHAQALAAKAPIQVLAAN